MKSYALVVPATVRWLDTQIQIQEGNQIDFGAIGRVSWTWDQNSNEEPAANIIFGPNGDASHIDGTTIYPNVAFCKLVGRIGAETDPSAQLLNIGASLATTATHTGRLYLAMNDLTVAGSFNDNWGAFVVGIEVFFTPQERDAARANGQAGNCTTGQFAVGPMTTTPINLRTGEKFEESTDLTIAAPQALSFQRNFRQSKLSEHSQVMGAGWIHNHALTIKTAPDNRLLVTLDGAVEGSYVQVSSSLYVSDLGGNGEIDSSGTGDSTYTLTTPNGTRYFFNAIVGSTPGQITRRRWLNGDEWTYEYYDTSDYQDGLLKEVRDDYENKLQFRYHDAVGLSYHKHLYRVADQSVTDLSASSPSGRYVEFNYEAGIGTLVALLSTVRDVRGQEWTYSYYGQDVGETDPLLANWLNGYTSPEVDVDGDGSEDEALVLKDVLYEVSTLPDDSVVIDKITQRRGKRVSEADTAFLMHTEYEFDAVAKTTTETTAERTITHVFAGEVYAGPVQHLGGKTTQGLLENYRPAFQEDANGHVTMMDWSEDGRSLLSVTDHYDHKIEFTYDAQARLVTSTNAQGQQMLYVYDGNRRQPSLVLTAKNAEEIDINGSMDADWPEFGSADLTQSASSTVVDGGTASRELSTVSTGSDSGIQSVEWQQTEDKLYLVVARVYPVAGQVSMQVQELSAISSLASGSMNTWQTLRLAYRASDTNAAQRLVFTLLPEAHCYIDSVHIIELEGFSTAGQIRLEQYAYDAKNRTLLEAMLTIDDRTTTDPDTQILGRSQETKRSYYSATVDLSEEGGYGLLKQVTQFDLGGTDDMTTTYTYDGAGRVKKVVQSSNFGSCEMRFTLYDEAGNTIASICNYVAPVEGDPTSIQDIDDNIEFDSAHPKNNNVTLYEYDALGRQVKTITNAFTDWEKTSLTLYDALSRVSRTVQNYEPQGTSAPGDWVFDGENWIRSATGLPELVLHGDENNQNIIAETRYNARGLVRWRQDVLGQVTLYGYDDDDRLVKTIQNASLPEYNNDYLDPDDPEIVGDPDLSAYSDPLNTAVDQNIVTSQSYDAVGNRVRSVDARGSVSYTVYDALNRAVKTVQNAKTEARIDLNPGDVGYAAANDPRSDDYVISTDPDRDQINLTEYDALSRVVRTRRLLENRGLLEQWDVTLSGYDTLGRQVRSVQHASQPEYNLSTDPALSAYVPGPALDQDFMTETQYDAAGRVLNTLDVYGRVTRQIYDGLGRVVRTIANYVAQETLTPGVLSNPALWVYEDSQWKQAPGGLPIQQGTNYDLNRITDTVYDEDGRVASTRDAAGRISASGQNDVAYTAITVQNFTNTTPTYAPVAGWVWQNGEWVDAKVAGTAIERGTGYDQNIISGTQYDDQGRVLFTRDSRGRVTRFVYDSSGRRIRTIQNYVEQTTLNPITSELEVVKPEAWVFEAGVWKQELGGTVIDHGIDEDDTPLNDQNLISETSYDLLGRTVSTRDTLGHQTRVTYDRLGRQVLQVMNYTASSEPTLWVWNTSNVRWEDGPDPLTSTAIEHGLHYDENLINLTVYNAEGQVESTRDARGTQTAMEYDAAGRSVLMTAAATSPVSISTYTSYDKAGRSLRRIATYLPDVGLSPDAWDNINPSNPWLFQPEDHGVNNDQNRITRFAYDAASRLIKTFDALEQVSETRYRKDGQVDHSLDALGIITLFRYDALGRRIRVVQNYHNPAALYTDPATWTWVAPVGLETEGHWEDGAELTISHDTTTLQKNDRNIVVSITYDAQGQISQMQTPRGAITMYTYDALGRRTKLTNPLLEEWETIYTELSNGTTRTIHKTPNLPALDIGIQRDYDRLGRLSTLTYGDAGITPNVRLNYTLAGDRQEMLEYSDLAFTSLVRQTGYTYDAAHRLIAVDNDLDGAGTTIETVTYGYDVSGRRTAMTLPGGLTISYLYDEQGRLSSLTDWDYQETSWSYDAAGRPLTQQRPINITTEYQYDVANRLTQLTHRKDSDVALAFHYTHDARGNRTQVQQDSEPTTLYTYNDPAIIAPEAWFDEAPYKVTFSWQATLSISFYGTIATLTYGTGPDHGRFDVYINGTLWQSFDGYASSTGEATATVFLSEERTHVLELRHTTDKARASYGTGLRFKQLAVFGPSNAPRLTTYTYDGLSRLIDARTIGGQTLHELFGYDVAGNLIHNNGTVRTYNVANQMTHNGATALTYDANGNLTNDGTNVYMWDRANRLLSMGDAVYNYDGDNNRRTQTVSSVATRYLLDTQPGLAQVLAETTETNTTRYLHAAQGIQAQQAANGDWFYHGLDGLGSVRGTWNESDVQQQSVNYSAYGTPDTAVTSFAFTGEPRDVNGLQYHRARYYNPALGIFPSLDPFEGVYERPMSLNGYSWVEGNVANATDASGRITIDIWAAAFIKPRIVEFPYGPDLGADWHGDGYDYKGDRPWHTMSDFNLPIDTPVSSRLWWRVKINTRDRLTFQEDRNVGTTQVDYGGFDGQKYSASETTTRNPPATVKCSGSFDGSGAPLTPIPPVSDAVVTMGDSSKNPLNPVAPGIEIYYSIGFGLQSGRVNILRRIDAFPWHELHIAIDGKELIHWSQEPIGPTYTPLDLFNGAVVETKELYNAFPVEPICKSQESTAGSSSYVSAFNTGCVDVNLWI